MISFTFLSQSSAKSSSTSLTFFSRRLTVKGVQKTQQHRALITGHSYIPKKNSQLFLCIVKNFHSASLTISSTLTHTHTGHKLEGGMKQTKIHLPPPTQDAQGGAAINSRPQVDRQKAAQLGQAHPQQPQQPDPPSVLVSCCLKVLAVMANILCIRQNRTTSLHSS